MQPIVIFFISTLFFDHSEPYSIAKPTTNTLRIIMTIFDFQLLINVRTISKKPIVRGEDKVVKIIVS